MLLVDDEPALARFGKQCLEGLGYTVVAVTSSSDALDLIEEGAKRCQTIVQKLMKYARKGPDADMSAILNKAKV